MSRNALLTVCGLTLSAAFLVACAGLPVQAQVPGTTNSVASISTVAPTKGVQTPAVEPTAAGTPIASHGGPVVDYVSLVDTLRAGGAKVDPAGQIMQPFFSPIGQAIKINGSDVQVFEYADRTSADAEAAKVAPDGGSVGTSMVSWVDAPHFHKAGKIIVLYVGVDTGIMGALDNALGPQFAGR